MLSFTYQNAQAIYPLISQGSFKKITIFYNLLNKWQKTIPLIGGGENVLLHFMDSLEFCHLLSGLKNINNIVDFGTGNGFPAIIIGILFDCEIICTEKNFKKCCFLKEVIRTLDLKNILLHDNLIEKLILNKSVDYFVSRALGDLSSLFRYMTIVSRETILKALLFKGKKVFQEIAAAEKEWKFSYKLHHSTIRKEGIICEVNLINDTNNNSR